MTINKIKGNNLLFFFLIFGFIGCMIIECIFQKYFGITGLGIISMIFLSVTTTHDIMVDIKWK